MSENTGDNAVGVIGQGGVISYQCPHCGGPLNFGSGTITKCEHCGTEAQRISPPIKLTEPIGQSDDDGKGRDDGGRTYSMGGFYPMMWLPLYMALIASHSTYTSAYRGINAAHPAHAHGAGGFMG